MILTIINDSEVMITNILDYRKDISVSVITNMIHLEKLIYQNITLNTNMVTVFVVANREIVFLVIQ